MKRIFALLVLSGTLLAGNADTELFFSMDNGKTWSQELPVLKRGNRKLLVKAKGSVTEEKPFHQEIILTRLLSRRDFASANSVGPKKEFAQKLKVYYASPKLPFEFIYPLDLGERGKGVVGVENKWDSSRKKWIDAPMPEVRSYAPGAYPFTLRIYWRVKSGGKTEMVRNDNEFTVTIEE